MLAQVDASTVKHRLDVLYEVQLPVYITDFSIANRETGSSLCRALPTHIPEMLCDALVLVSQLTRRSMPTNWRSFCALRFRTLR